jgi:hypothetical protein
MFSTLADPICLAKIQAMLLRDLVGICADMAYEDED